MTVFIEGVTNGRHIVYRAHHRPTTISVETTRAHFPDPAPQFPAVRSELLAKLAEAVGLTRKAP